MQSSVEFFYIIDIVELNGTLHLPLAYMLENTGKALVYKLVTKPEVGLYHYQFTRYRRSDIPYQVPCMSTCGMMITRNLYNRLGGWPKELGIYGGGEHFINFSLAILGKNVNIFPTEPLHHYAEKRGYNYEYVDYKRNMIIATYIFGGEKRAELFSKNCKLDQKTARQILYDVIGKCKDHREYIKSQQVIDIDEWCKQWRPTT